MKLKEIDSKKVVKALSKNELEKINGGGSKRGSMSRARVD